MSTNPLTDELNALKHEQANTSRELMDWETKVAWYQRFNLEQGSLDLRRAERIEAELNAKLKQEREAQSALSSLVNELARKAGMSIDPRYWFSSKRAIARRLLAEEQQKLIAQRTRCAAIETELSKALESCRLVKGQVAMARTFDPLLAHSAINALRATLDRLKPLLPRLQARSDELDGFLREPLKSLRDLEAERTVLRKKISVAEGFNRELTNASHGKRQIHERCRQALGEGSPGIVLKNNEGLLRRVDDDIRKLQIRINTLIRLATRDVRNVVVDANNLCYENRRFLGLCVLEAIVPILAQKYEVTLIFDASIRRQLGLGNKEIEGRFPEAKQVHVVASKRKADETVLAVAGDDAYTFVLSNDRFVDYPEKLVVKEDRLLRHAIVGDLVIVHDLNVTVRFEDRNVERVGTKE